MAATRFKTNYNGKNVKKDVPCLTAPSLTVPNMSKSVPEIIRAYASGNPPDIMKQVIWNQNPQFDDFLPRVESMDFVEIMELHDTMQERIDTIKEQQAKVKQDEHRNLVDKLTDLEKVIADRESELEKLKKSE